MGMRYNLPVRSPLDDGGIFTAEAGGPFEGKSVLGEGNAAVVSALADAGALLKVRGHAHLLVMLSGVPWREKGARLTSHGPPDKRQGTALSFLGQSQRLSQPADGRLHRAGQHLSTHKDASKAFTKKK